LAQCGASGPYLAATGQVVDRLTGAAIGGVRVDVVRRGGGAVEQDSLSALTGGDGFWRVEFAPTEEGSIDVDIRVSPPGLSPYVVRGVRLVTRPRRGDANLNQTWVAEPYFSYAGELYLRGTVDDRVRNTPVEFRLTGGVRTRGSGVTDSVYKATTDGSGRVELFPQREEGGLLPVGGGVLVGDLVVHLATGRVVLRDVNLTPSYIYFGSVTVIRLEVAR
jgi:hypothetical protein